MAALLLRLADVPIDAVAADYAVSAQNLRPRSVTWIAEGRDEVEQRRRARIAETPAAAMTGVFERLEQRHGGVAAFLRRHGLDEADARRIRARLSG